MSTHKIINDHAPLFLTRKIRLSVYGLKKTFGVNIRAKENYSYLNIELKTLFRSTANGFSLMYTEPLNKYINSILMCKQEETRLKKSIIHYSKNQVASYSVTNYDKKKLSQLQFGNIEALPKI